MKRTIRPLNLAKPIVITRDQTIASEQRDDERRAQLPVRATTSTSPRRCSHCREYRVPNKSGRCTVCRQLFVPQPLVGLKPAS